MSGVRARPEHVATLRRICSGATTSRSSWLAVVGSVKTPGRYELKSPATVLELIALAQGLTDFASRDRIVILRQTNGETKRIPFNYRKVAAGDDQANLVVQSGDIIVVP